MAVPLPILPDVLVCWPTGGGATMTFPVAVGDECLVGLHQRSAVPGQEYSFRYFQQLGGSVMLPKDFTPQRVRISLTGPGGSANQTFDWKLAGSGRGE
mgnify:CR=1 FL=1